MTKTPWILGGLAICVAIAAVPVAAQQGAGNLSSQKQAEAISMQRDQRHTQTLRERMKGVIPKPAAAQPKAPYDKKKVAAEATEPRIIRKP